MRVADYENEYLDAFIEGKIPRLTKKYTTQGGSGTINHKVAFCKKAIAHIQAVGDLSESALTVAQSILAFIKKSNQ